MHSAAQSYEILHSGNVSSPIYVSQAGRMGVDGLLRDIQHPDHAMGDGPHVASTRGVVRLSYSISASIRAFSRCPKDLVAYDTYLRSLILRRQRIVCPCSQCGQDDFIDELALARRHQGVPAARHRAAGA